LAFRGTFDHTLDAKNRLTVPAKFRAQLADGVVLAKGIERCVTLWIPDEYDAYTAAALADRNPASPEARALKRFYAANATDTELDGAGRVMVPSVLMEHGDLSREVVVTGAGECLEVWDRATWSTYNAALSERVAEITESLDHPS
jgi:MraZ protein